MGTKGAHRLVRPRLREAPAKASAADGSHTEPSASHGGVASLLHPWEFYLCPGSQAWVSNEQRTTVRNLSSPSHSSTNPGISLALATLSLAAIIGCGGCGSAEDSLDDLYDSAAIGGITGRIHGLDGKPAAGVLVALDGPEGDIVLTDEQGRYEFLSVAPGRHEIYALRQEELAAASAAVEARPDMPNLVATLALVRCVDIAEDRPDLIDVCYIWNLDLPPSDPAASVATLSVSGGQGVVNQYQTLVYGDSGDAFIEFGSSVRLVFGSSQTFDLDALTPDERLTAALLTIRRADGNGQQRYMAVQGQITLDVQSGDGPRLAYTMSGQDLVLEYMAGGTSGFETDPRYRLAVGSLRVTGTLIMDLPAEDPTADISLASFTYEDLSSYYEPELQYLQIAPRDLQQNVFTNINMDLSDWQMPGTTDVVLPLGGIPVLGPNSASIEQPDRKIWSFQLESYTVTTDMQGPPSCENPRARFVLEDLVFRYVDWNYDADGNRIEVFGPFKLYIDRIAVNEALSIFPCL